MTSGIANGEREYFRRFLYEQGRQPSTIASYVAEVEKFSGRGTFSSREDILSYKQWLLDQGRISSGPTSPTVLVLSKPVADSSLIVCRTSSK